MNLINEAIEDYETNTCLRFKPRTEETDYIMIASNNTGCWSIIGRNSGAQTVNLQTPNCVILKGTILHELMHTSGFNHEHVREDRDNYVQINWNSIQSCMYSPI